MNGWTFFFILVGVVFLTSQLFRVVDAIERPARHRRRRPGYHRGHSPVHHVLRGGPGGGA